jgi:predicted amidohydrolase YtcJ
MATVLLRNAALLTMDPARPRAQAVLVRGDRIGWVGTDADVPAGSVDRVIDCGGATLIPGLNDAHIHLLAYASSLSDLDTSRGRAGSIGDIQALIRDRVGATPRGRWVRGRGYDDAYLAEGRHPTRWDLDAAAPEHPVRLDHRSGHALVLNSRGLELAGISPDTPDPPEGVIVRDESGQPTGLLLEMAGYVSSRVREHSDPGELRKSVEEACRNLLKWGVTSLQDASPENDPERWDMLKGMQADRVARQRLTVMPGLRHLRSFVGRGLSYGAGGPGCHVGHAKLMVAMTTGAIYPSEEEIRSLVAEAHGLGFPVAVHAVEEEAITAVLRALGRGDAGFSDRVEHCSEATPGVQALLKESGVTVVTQPGFIYESGERYAAQVSADILPWLYPLRSLRDMGLSLAAGSDAPVAQPDPWRGIYAATTRRDASGLALHPEQRLSLEEALHLYTAGAASASGEGGVTGMVRPGMVADLALLDRDVTLVESDGLLNCGVSLTMIGGEVVWEG